MSATSGIDGERRTRSGAPVCYRSTACFGADFWGRLAIWEGALGWPVAPFQGLGGNGSPINPGRCPGLAYGALSGLGWQGLAHQPRAVPWADLWRPFRAGVARARPSTQGGALGWPMAPFQGSPHVSGYLLGLHQA